MFRLYKRLIFVFLFLCSSAYADGMVIGASAGCVTPALTYVGGNSNSASTGTAISCTHGLTINSGDLVAAVVHVNGDYTIADNNGAYAFTEADEDNLTSNDRAIYWRVAGASEPSAYNWTLSSSDRWGVIVFVLRPNSGCSVQSPPFDVATTTPNSGNSTTPTALSITLGEDHVAVIAVSYVDSETITHSAIPSGYTEIADITGQTTEVSYLLDQSSGATGNQGWTISSSGTWEAELFSFKPGN